MAYNDKKSGQLFPTRHGGASGTSNERAMLDRLGSSEGYRKQWRLNADGSTTRLDTRNGAPRFITTRPEENQPEEVVTSAYMETGQLELMPFAPEHPDRGKPSKWHFIGTDTESDYLGKIKIAEKGLGDQKNKPALTEDMDSLAIGYPRSDDPVEDAERKAQYLDLTIMKGLVASLFPASLWSGAMRLFMQAQYGAKETAGSTPLQADIVGTEIVLRYFGGSGESIQLGLWGHHSPGIFSALDSQDRPLGKFWLITITNPTGYQFIATSYKLKFNTVGKALLRQYRKLAKRSGFSAAIRAKLEAYLYAHCTIDVANPKIVGGFEGAPGGPLAYGWKFNSTGSKASMVSHQTLGDSPGTLRWNANTTHATFTHSFSEETKTDVLAVSVQVDPGGEWTDGWGAYNIFVPMLDVGNDQLTLYSLAVNQVYVKPSFAFSVPVYGFYKEDVWHPVIMSRSVEAGPWPKYEQQCSMPYPDPSIPDTTVNRFQYDARLADQGYTWRATSRTASSTMDLTVLGNTFIGVSWYGFHDEVSVTVDAGSWGGPGSWGNYINETLSDGNLYFVPEAVYGHPPGSPPPPGLRDGAEYFSARRGTSTTDEWHTTGWRFHKWTLVIPAFDCEAVFVGTHEYDANDSVVHSRTNLTGVVTALKQDGNVVTPYTGYVGVYSGITSSTDSDPPPTPTAEIFCFTPWVPGTQGTYHASSTPLFIVDKNWPYYMAGMGSLTSYGGKYAISEGLMSHPSVVYQNRFVGWA